MALAAISVALTNPAAEASGQSYYWKWSDGSRDVTRVFTQARWGLQSNLPEIVITATPALPSHLVVLQAKRDRTWTTETSARIGHDGVATIEIDPYCANAAWCRGSYPYRLSVDGQTAPLTLIFS